MDFLKRVLKPVLISLGVDLLESESIHTVIRDFAKKTTNTFDDTVAEGVIELMKSIAKKLKGE